MNCEEANEDAIGDIEINIEWNMLELTVAHVVVLASRMFGR